MGDDRDPIDIMSRIRARDEKPDGPPFGLQKRDQYTKSKHCLHKLTTLDSRARVIECRSCGELLDPWHVLETLSRAFESGWRWERWARSAARDATDLQEEVKRLKAERAHLRAAIKREGGRLGKLTRTQAIELGEVKVIGS